MTDTIDRQTAITQIPTRIAGIRFQKLGKLYHFDCSDFPEIVGGDYVIGETARGRQMGQVMGFIAPEQGGERNYKPILRIASPRDLVMKQTWESRQLEALVECREKAQQMGGYDDCKFLDAQYNYDGSTLMILFSAEDNKISTNRLRGALSNMYKAKVELRQVGPRDEAKLIGGFWARGVTRCSSTFLTPVHPVSLNMGKDQSISLNPPQTTPTCGPLRHCVVYR